MRAIDGFAGEAVTRAALRLAPRRLVRPGELRAPEWSDYHDQLAASAIVIPIGIASRK